MGVFLSAQQSPLLCGVQSAKRTSSGATGERKSSSSPTLTRTPSPTPAAPRIQLRLSGKTKKKKQQESFFTSPGDSSSHGRIPTRNAIPGPAACFPWEYTVFPVCCYHLSLCAEEKQGSQDLSSGRTQVIQIPKRHFRVLASHRGPPQRRAKGRYCAA